MTKLAAMLGKETRVLTRQRRFVVLLAALMAALGLTIVLNWEVNQRLILVFGYQPSTGIRVHTGPPPSGPAIPPFQMRAILARSLLGKIVPVEIAVLGLLAAALAAGAITRERAERTYDLLLITGFTPGNILWGKLLGLVAALMLMAVCTLPMLGLVFQLGGVGLDEYLRDAGLIVLSIATYAMLGLAISSQASRSIRAQSIALALALLLLLGPCLYLPAALNPLRSLIAPGGRPSYFDPRAGLSPIVSISPLTVRLTQGLPSSSPVNAHLAFQAMLFTIGFIVCRRGLTRRETSRVAVAAPIIDNPDELKARSQRWPYYVIDPLRRPEPIGDAQNPFDVKERRIGLLANRSLIFRLGYSIMFGSLMVFPLFEMLVRASPGLGPAMWDDRSRPYAGYLRDLVLSLVTLTVILSAPLVTSLISREREDGTYGLLRSLPVSAWSIVAGKYWAALRLIVFLGGCYVILPYFFYLLIDRLTFTFSGIKSFSLDVIWTTTIVVYTAALLLLVPAIGIWASARTRTRGGAVGIYYGTIAALCLAPQILDGIVLPIISSAYALAVGSHPPLALEGWLDVISRVFEPILSPLGFMTAALPTSLPHSGLTPEPFNVFSAGDCLLAAGFAFILAVAFLWRATVQLRRET